MAKPIEISFISDVRDVVRDTSTLAERFDEVSDALADIATVDTSDAADGLSDAEREAKDLIDTANKATREMKDFREAGEDAGDGLRTGARKGEDAVDDLRAKVRESFRSIGDDSRDAGDALGDSTRRGAREAGEGLDEFKDEANSTAREAAASFDGSADSIIEVFQEVSANAFAGFGPAGAAAGLAAAAGIGILISQLQGASEEAEETAGRVADLAREINEAGSLEDIDWTSRMADWGLEIQDNKEWWELWQDTAKTGLEQVRDLSQEAGLRFGDMFKGAAGDAQDAADALTEIEAQIKYVEEAATYTTDAYSGMQTMDPVSQGQLDALGELRDLAEQNAEELGRAEEVERLMAEAGIETAAAVEEANAALEEHAEHLRAVADSNIGAAESAINYQEKLASATETIATNGQVLDITTEAGRANQGALTDLASATLSHVDALIAQGDSTATVTSYTQAARDSFINAATAAGHTREEAARLADQYGLVPDSVDTWVQAHNVAQTEAEIDGVARPREAVVDLRVGTDHVTPWIQGYRPTIHADIVANSSVFQAMDD